MEFQASDEGGMIGTFEGPLIHPQHLSDEMKVVEPWFASPPAASKFEGHPSKMKP